jgi:hypothetical protein
LRARSTPPRRSTAAATDDREPVSDELFAAYSRVFDYDRTPLNERIEDVDETRVWTRERITLDSAYGADRVIVHLYLPTTGREPFQTVVYWSGWDTFRLDDVDHYFARQIDFIVKERSGGRVPSAARHVRAAHRQRACRTAVRYDRLA